MTALRVDYRVHVWGTDPHFGHVNWSGRGQLPRYQGTLSFRLGRYDNTGQGSEHPAISWNSCCTTTTLNLVFLPFFCTQATIRHHHLPALLTRWACDSPSLYNLSSFPSIPVARRFNVPSLSLLRITTNQYCSPRPYSAWLYSVGRQNAVDTFIERR